MSGEPEPGPDEIPAEEPAPAGPPEPMGWGFYAAVLVIAILVAMILFLNYAGQRAEAGASLSGTNWSLRSLGGNGTSAGVLPDTPVTLGFGPAGTLDGSTGCIRYRARYATAEYDMNITDISVARLPCPDPRATAQESAFLAGLSRVAFFRVSTSSLKLYDEQGNVIAVFAPL